MPDPIADREREQDHRHPQRETLELAAAIAARTLRADHSVTKALAKASITMAKADLWKARLAVKTLRIEQRRLAPVGLLYGFHLGYNFPPRDSIPPLRLDRG